MTKVIRKDGTTYDLDSLGIRTKDFVIDSLSPKNTIEEVSGGDGAIDLGTTFDPRKIKCSFKMVASSMSNFVALRNQIFTIFKSNETFYLVDEREPQKQWEVKCSNSFSLQQQFIYGDFDVEFISFKSYALSNISSLQYNGSNYTMQATGTGAQYSFNATSFSVWNDGNITIDPRLYKLIITFAGASTNLAITNTTTGDQWSYTGSSVAGNTIILDGIKATKNSLTIFGNTNKKLITLKPGLNNFTIAGAAGSFTITFDFNFLYI